MQVSMMMMVGSRSVLVFECAWGEQSTAGWCILLIPQLLLGDLNDRETLEDDGD